jgi:hypothetical protein
VLSIASAFLYISHISPDDGLSGIKHVLRGILKTFVCVMVTSLFLFLMTLKQNDRCLNRHITKACTKRIVGKLPCLGQIYDVMV